MPSIPCRLAARRGETINACSLIHGASKENALPALTGMLDTITSKFKSDVVAFKILGTKEAVTEAISKRCEKKFCRDYYKSEENILRSIYNSYNVIGKRKYLRVLRASYEVLSDRIRNIDIGTVE